jgi:putative FmdB family regulatory protein
MPTYEYVCEKCGHQFDLFQSMNDKPLAVCPQDRCPRKRWGKGRVKRLVGAGGGLIFKGSGFYINDYRSDKYKEAAKKETPAPASSSSGSDTKASPAKTETKPPPSPKPAK